MNSFPFQDGYQVDFHEDVLGYIILRIPLQEPYMLREYIQIEQFGYSVKENTKSLLLSSFNSKQYSTLDDADTVEITCFRRNNTNNENISLLLQMDSHEKGKANILIKDSLDLTEGDQKEMYCTSKGSIINVINPGHPIMLDTEKTLQMEVESVSQESSNYTLVRCSALENTSNMHFRMMIFIYRSVDDTRDEKVDTDLEAATMKTEKMDVSTPKIEEASTEMELTTETVQFTTKMKWITTATEVANY